MSDSDTQSRCYVSPLIGPPDGVALAHLYFMFDEVRAAAHFAGQLNAEKGIEPLQLLGPADEQASE